MTAPLPAAQPDILDTLFSPVVPPAARVAPAQVQGLTWKSLALAMAITSVATAALMQYLIGHQSNFSAQSLNATEITNVTHLVQRTGSDNPLVWILHWLNVTDAQGHWNTWPILVLAIGGYFKGLIQGTGATPARASLPAVAAQNNNSIYDGKAGEYLNELRYQKAQVATAIKTQEEVCKELEKTINAFAEKLSKKEDVSNDPGFKKFLEKNKAPEPKPAAVPQAKPAPAKQNDSLIDLFYREWNAQVDNRNLNTRDLVQFIFRKLDIAGNQEVQKVILSAPVVEAMIATRTQLEQATQRRR